MVVSCEEAGQSARVLASGSVVSRGGYRELTGTGVGAAAERLLQPAPGDLEAVGSGQPFVRSPEAAERKETTERQRGPPAAEVSGARQVSVPAEPGGTVGECEGNGAAKEAAGGAVNARCSADPPAQAGNGTWGAAPGWETRRRPPSPACGRGAGGGSRPGADAGCVPSSPELPPSLLPRPRSPRAAAPSSGSSCEPVPCSWAAPKPRREGGKPALGISPVAPAEGAGWGRG
ncbi:uncharacterized protein [Patagioenas fasciata]|uniref:uncharacterized protein n=1 Tax=Patagioenas fasciata TaxID=372321 RepID=UPI003A9A4DD3